MLIFGLVRLAGFVLLVVDIIRDLVFWVVLVWLNSVGLYFWSLGFCFVSGFPVRFCVCTFGGWLFRVWVLGVLCLFWVWLICCVAFCIDLMLAVWHRNVSFGSLGYFVIFGFPGFRWFCFVLWILVYGVFGVLVWVYWCVTLCWFSFVGVFCGFSVGDLWVDCLDVCGFLLVLVLCI